MITGLNPQTCWQVCTEHGFLFPFSNIQHRNSKTSAARWVERLPTATSTRETALEGGSSRCRRKLTHNIFVGSSTTRWKKMPNGL